MASKYLKQSFAGVFGVKGLAPTRPVYLLQMEDDTGIVIKKEQGVASAANLKHNLSIMKTVNRQSEGKLLDAGEIQAVQDYLSLSKAYQQSLHIPEEADTVELRLDFQGAATAGWFKMEEAPGLITVASALKQLQNNDKQGVRLIAKTLNEQGGFETLGRIVAADIYNGNGDRFSLNDGPGVKAGYYDEVTQTKYRVIFNLGNVLVSVRKKDRLVLGLDSYDPNNKNSDINQTIEALDAKADFDFDKWQGGLLSSGQTERRKAFCADIFEDLNDILGPRNRRFYFLKQKRLDPKRAARISKGMDEGRRLII